MIGAISEVIAYTYNGCATFVSGYKHRHTKVSGQRLPPRDLAPPDLGRLPLEKRASIWVEMLDTGYKLVIAGLAHRVGANGDVMAAYRDWYAEQMTEHDRVVERMLCRMQQRQ